MLFQMLRYKSLCKAISKRFLSIRRLWKCHFFLGIDDYNQVVNKGYLSITFSITSIRIPIVERTAVTVELYTVCNYRFEMQAAITKYKVAHVRRPEAYNSLLYVRIMLNFLVIQPHQTYISLIRNFSSSNNSETFYIFYLVLINNPLQQILSD